LQNDLALIELDSSVQFERHIQPICLPVRGDQFIDAEANVSGWGLLSYVMFQKYESRTKVLLSYKLLL
jgi:hypothetical protein